MRLFYIASVSATLALCTIGTPSIAAEGFNAAQKAAAERSVADLRDEFDLKLVDYTSARFRNVVASAWRGTDSVRICGLVNAKNRSGGYAGWNEFAYSGGYLLTGPDDADQIAKLCAPSDARIQDTKDYSSDLTFKGS